MVDKHSAGTDSVSDVFRNAAKYLEEGRTVCGCCKAIQDVGGKGYMGEHADLMQQNFPEGMRGGWGRYGAGTNGPRIIALCFMAAMVERP